MRFVKLFFALVIGLIVAAAVAIAGLFILVAHRLFGRSRVAVRGGGQSAARPAAQDVIEVTATEVSEPAQRLPR